MQWISAAILLCAFCAETACRGDADRPGQPASDDAGRDAAEARAPTPADAAPQPVIVRFDTGGRDERKALAGIDAVGVWTAVIDRGAYLARRQRSGAAYGRVGGPVPGSEPARYRWFIDEDHGAGSLGVRLLLPDAARVAEGERIVAWGAWRVDDQLRWYWHADRAARLAPRDPEHPPELASPPGHVIVDVAEPDPTAVPVSRADRGPVDILFEVTRIPGDPSFGWEVADRSEWPAVALLHLPGDEASYGAQDLRSPDERWKLVRRVRYTVRVKRFMPARRPGELTRMTAISAPRRVPGRTPPDLEPDSSPEPDSTPVSPREPEPDSTPGSPREPEPDSTPEPDRESDAEPEPSPSPGPRSAPAAPPGG